MTTYRKKLIEVALPLEAINRESAKEKSIRHGHPSALHLWWARRPLAACRAVLFGQLVDDPSSVPEEFPTEEVQVAERERLFRIIEKMVVWKNSNDEAILHQARMEIARSVARGKAIRFNPKMNRDEVLKFLAEHAPPVLDPFCGGGSIPLEAQRLGLRAYGSDLNPVAVLITKALIEIPPKFANKPPVNSEAQKQKKLKGASGWKGAQGLADDVRYYGEWMRNEAEKRIGDLYPKAKLPAEMGGGEATVIAWLWARTVTCPNPACKVEMPLVRSFNLSTKKDKAVFVAPVVHGTDIRFTVAFGGAPPAGTVTRGGATCLVCKTAVPFAYVRGEGRARRLRSRLMAIAVDGQKGRTYIAPTTEQEQIAASARSGEVPDTELPDKALGFRVQAYGMTKHRHLFTSRQLAALAVFSGLIHEVRVRVQSDATSAAVRDATTYANAVSTYLGLCSSKAAAFHNSLARWRPGEDKSAPAFGRQAISMVWDYAEVNPFAGAGGDFLGIVEGAAGVLQWLGNANAGNVVCQDAAADWAINEKFVVCTDPPYYDNIGYADLADFFYAWLRPMLIDVYPDLLATILTPKDSEIIAAASRFDGDESRAQEFFEKRLGQAFAQMNANSILGGLVTVFYAFKQSEEGEDDEEELAAGQSSTGWETMLEGLLRAGYSITGTWPSRTEGATRMRGQGSNALATSIVLVCRPRPATAPVATRQDFIRALKAELPGALKKLQQGNIAPVDLAQAAIGPGMAVYSRFTKVVEASGSSMLVRTGLALINQVLDEVLAEQESEFDSETRWAISWFDQHGVAPGPYGDAETLSKAKNTAVSGLVEAGLLESKQGKVRLLKREEMPADYDPTTDTRITVWEVAQHLIRRLMENGEPAAAELAAKAGGLAEVAKDLAYRLYTTCERKGWSQEAIPYNALVTAWPEISRLASGVGKKTGLEAFG